MASTKWGELEEDSNGTEREAIAFNDIVRLRADSMPIKQPSSSHHPPKPSLSKEKLNGIRVPLNRDGHNTILHNIELIQHIRSMNRILAQQQQAETTTTSSSDSINFKNGILDNVNKLTSSSKELQMVPAPPDRYGKTDPSSASSMSSKRTIFDHGPVAKIRKATVTELDAATAHQLMIKAAASVCSHAGFETAFQSCLEVLADIMHQHMTKVCTLLRYNVDYEKEIGSCPVNDPFEQVLYQVGINGIPDLLKDWQSDVKYYNTKLQTLDLQLIQDCKQLMGQSSEEMHRNESIESKCNNNKRRQSNDIRLLDQISSSLPTSKILHIPINDNSTMITDTKENQHRYNGKLPSTDNDVNTNDTEKSNHKRRLPPQQLNQANLTIAQQVQLTIPPVTDFDPDYVMKLQDSPSVSPKSTGKRPNTPVRKKRKQKI